MIEGTWTAYPSNSRIKKKQGAMTRLNMPRALLISWMGGDVVTRWCRWAVVAVVGSCTRSLALWMKSVVKKKKRKHTRGSRRVCVSSPMPCYHATSSSCPSSLSCLVVFVNLSWPVVIVACCHCCASGLLLTRLVVVVRSNSASAWF